MSSHEKNTARLVLLAAITSVIAACGSSGSRKMPTPMATNTAPTISAIADRSVDQDTVIPVEFGVTDRESDVGRLTLTATTDSGAVFPADGVMLGGSGTTRTLTLTPLEATTGSSVITLTLTDPEGASATRTFRVTVNSRGASMRDAALTTFAKAEADAPTAVNGYTFAQDADDPAIFEPLIGAE